MKPCKQAGLFNSSLPRLAWLGLGLLGSIAAGPGRTAEEPPANADDGPSLELLEFLADYGTDSGELALPETLEPVADQAAVLPADADPTGPAQTTGMGETKR